MVFLLLLFRTTHRVPASAGPTIGVLHINSTMTIMWDLGTIVFILFDHAAAAIPLRHVKARARKRFEARVSTKGERGRR